MDLALARNLGSGPGSGTGSSGPGVLTFALLAFSLLFSSSAFAQNSRANELFEQGRQAFEAGDIERAFELFQSSLALESQARTLLNLGVTTERLGHLPDAVEYFERYVASHPPDADRIHARIQRIRRSPGRVAIRTAPLGALIRVDSSDQIVAATPAVLVVPPGRHTFHLSREGCESASRTVEVPFGTEISLDVQLERVPGHLEIAGEVEIRDGEARIGEAPLTLHESTDSRSVTLHSADSTVRFTLPLTSGETTTIEPDFDGGQSIFRIGTTIGAAFARSSGGAGHAPAHVQVDIDLEFAPACSRTCILTRASLGFRPTGDGSMFIQAMAWLGVDQQLGERFHLTLSTGTGIGHFFGVAEGQRLSWWPEEAAVLGAGVHPMLGLDAGIHFRVSDRISLRLHPLTMRYAIVDAFPGGFLQFSSSLGFSVWI